MTAPAADLEQHKLRVSAAGSKMSKAWQEQNHTSELNCGSHKSATEKSRIE
jgi:hypothetical protein